MKSKILNLDNKAAGDVELDDAIFGLEPRQDLIQRVVVWQLAKRRSGQHKVLTRGEINRTKHRVGKQKGGGTARHGQRHQLGSELHCPPSLEDIDSSYEWRRYSAQAGPGRGANGHGQVTLLNAGERGSLNAGISAWDCGSTSTSGCSEVHRRVAGLVARLPI